MSVTDTYLQPDAPDPVLGESSVLEAVRRHAPWAGALLEVDESGGEARSYHVEGDVVLKTQRPHRLRPRTSLEKEALFLRELERSGDFPVPKVLGYGHVEGIEYLCLSRMPGVAVKNATLDPAARAEALHELGGVLRRIHAIDQTALNDSGLLPGDEGPAGLRTRIADTFETLATTLGDNPSWNGAVDVRALAAARLEATPDTTAPVAVHSNPGPEHTFIDPTTGRFTGLIDFGDAYRSHPALDLRPWTDPDDARNLLDGYHFDQAVPDGFEEVHRTGLIIIELARAARGIRSTDETVAALDRLV
ncbi:MAG TPA: aminoglycoside phosphotransferase family protein [Gaiellaceae bacterium]|nr:aminoglycoside phosphotransferase family protein [Gaiellaceae bacterium]